MDYNIEYINGNVRVTNFGGIDSFSLKDTLESGQYFRFSYNEKNSRFSIIIKNMYIEIQQNNDELFFYNLDKVNFNYVFFDFFDFSQDYGKIKNELSKDSTLKKMIAYAPGIHILKQDLWETLICFIISQNNNIKRIKGIVENFCQLFGNPVDGYPHIYVFPTLNSVKNITISDLSSLRAGFRDKYIIDAIEKCKNKEVDLGKISVLSYDKAQKNLMLIKGVGPKVSDCVLLFGNYRIEAFPIDVWMKRAMEAFFINGLPENALPFAGIAQQYIFHYARTSGEFL